MEEDKELFLNEYEKEAFKGRLNVADDKEFEIFKEYTIATYRKESKDGSQTVHVILRCLPIHVYRIEVAPNKKIGAKACTIHFGIVNPQFVHSVAEAISLGMMGVCKIK